MIRRSSAPIGSWPASCTPTSTPTRPRRRGSRRSASPTRCSATRRSAASSTWGAIRWRARRGGQRFGGFGGLGDVFEAFFGGGTTSRGPIGRVRPGADSLLRMRLDLAECATGVTKQVTVDTAVLCDLCQGKGTHANSTPIACDTCGGRGEIQTVQRSLLGQVMTSRPCPVCGGIGEVIPDPCHRCGGDGRVRARREISVKIPPVSATACGCGWRPRARSGPAADRPATYVRGGPRKTPRPLCPR